MYSSYRSTNPQLNEEASLGILKHLNKQELQKLLDDDANVMELINDDQQIKQFQVEKDSLLTSNRSVAEYNLSIEPRLTQSRRQLASTYEQAVSVQKEYDDKKQKLEFQTSQNSLDTALALLQTETAKSEEQSEEMANQFLEGKIEVDSFVDDYLARQTVAHLRKVRVEKMQELIRGGGVNTQVPVPAATAAPVSTGPAPYQPAGGWGGPYPASQMAMPNPAAYLRR